MKNHLEVSEIFYSFQGESTLVGRPTVFIRLSGCNLRCSICDTKHALLKGKKMGVDKIISAVSEYKAKCVCITGGEPLLQGLDELIKKLLQMGKTVSLETNGSIDIALIDKRVKRIVDVKTPSTGEEGSFLKKNLKQLTKNDELKFVISDKKDFDYSLNFINAHDLPCAILFSPNLKNKKNKHDLVKWILKSKKDIIFQPQLHKLVKENPTYILR